MTTRRGFIAAAGAGALAAGCSTGASRTCAARKDGFRYALNPATIRGYKCSIREQVRLCIQAGYGGIDVGAVVDDDFRLKRTHKENQLFGFPSVII